MCELCSAKNKTWESKSFFGYMCITCSKGKTVFIVLKEHKSSLNALERKELDEMVSTYHPGYKSSNFASRSKPEHWHDLYIKTKT